MDEKGFLIGCLTKLYRIFSKKAWEDGHLNGAGQDGNRNWITILATICADGTYIPPAIIYPSEASDIQPNWLQDYEPEQQPAFFTALENGWTNNEIGYEWLTTIFDRYTKRKASLNKEWRLLICDGHGSHLNMEFLDWCHKNKILVAVFPPHSTHRLQPLDVSLFSPLAKYYSRELDYHMAYSQGLFSVGKRHF